MKTVLIDSLIIINHLFHEKALYAKQPPKAQVAMKPKN